MFLPSYQPQPLPGQATFSVTACFATASFRDPMMWEKYPDMLFLSSKGVDASRVFREEGQSVAIPLLLRVYC